MNVLELRVRGSCDPAVLDAVRSLLSSYPEVRGVRAGRWLDTVAVFHEGDLRVAAECVRTLRGAGYQVERSADGWPLEPEPDAAA